MSIRVGFLGAGLIAAYHAIQLNIVRDGPGPDNRIVAVHDPDVERAAGLASGQGAEVCATPQEVIERSDAVFVCTWTAEHLPMVRLVAEAGVPLFCEKPLSLDLPRSRELVELVRASGVVNMVGLVMRSSPTLLVMREMIQDPTSGRVMNVVFRDDQYIPTQGMYASTWRGDTELAGSGALMEHSIHDLDLLEWLLGPVDTIGAHQSFFHGIDGIEDSVSALLRFTSGASGNLASIWHDVLARPSQRRMEVFCENATVTLESDDVGPVRRQTADDEVVVGGDDLLPWLAARGIAAPSSEEEFLRAVQAHLDGDTPERLRPDVVDALRAHVLADATYRSAAVGGDPVAIPAP
ncbi:Gfo/Idh/MocA family protein [Dermatobacter hominis]|uniref:Gfo/Idh/MocA family protein n=1 Tax=Dermatobacter hominis TaxID=2884263 RepID=UPI001D0FEDE6|nr:Gfo/Idh/MocA family oxidoreductase [Dermatobacter hominis]UDY36912.1 Gfo/Idh/MocA family oxidoreductase [Dermatobacter hominis]